jgi:hypothetical protein
MNQRSKERALWAQYHPGFIDFSQCTLAKVRLAAKLPGQQSFPKILVDGLGLFGLWCYHTYNGQPPAKRNWMKVTYEAFITADITQ